LSAYRIGSNASGFPFLRPLLTPDGALMCWHCKRPALPRHLWVVRICLCACLCALVTFKFLSTYVYRVLGTLAINFPESALVISTSQDIYPWPPPPSPCKTCTRHDQYRPTTHARTHGHTTNKYIVAALVMCLFKRFKCTALLFIVTGIRWGCSIHLPHLVLCHCNRRFVLCFRHVQLICTCI
jgi:hypothetical protein